MTAPTPEATKPLAIASALANVISLGYFALYFSRSGEALFSFAPKLLRRGWRILRDVLSCGLAGITMVALAMVSNCFLNAMISELGAGAAVAGLGRRLAEELGFEYYDREIVEQIAAHTSFSEEYIHQIVEGRRHRLYPITINHSFNFTSDTHAQMIASVFEAQSRILNEVASLSSCVIVGRCADYYLRERDPYRIFVYADMESRIRRCMARSEGSEQFTEKEIMRHIKRIDRQRARYYNDTTGQTWGDKRCYDLCVNTTNREIKALVPHIAAML